MHGAGLVLLWMLRRDVEALDDFDEDDFDEADQLEDVVKHRKE